MLTLFSTADSATVNSDALQKAEAAFEMTSSVVTLMGLSFIMGVLFMTFILVMLEFVRRTANQEDYEN